MPARMVWDMDIYFEEHGTPTAGRPVILLHGALSGIGTSFGTILPLLAKTRRVIAVEFQAHGRTPDADRPLRVEHLAADVIELMDRLGIAEADIFGWSMGAGVALELGTAYPSRIGRLVLASVSFDESGIHPGLMDGIQELRPEHLHGSEFHEEYLRTAPDPAGFATLVARVKDFDAAPPRWTPDQVRGLPMPTMLLLGDADIITPEHAVTMFRLLGGGVAGDITGLPTARLAVLPGTTHTGIPGRADLIVPMVEEFLAQE